MVAKTRRRSVYAVAAVGEAARDLRASYPAMDAWVKRLQARPAYQRALQRGGPYALAG